MKKNYLLLFVLIIASALLLTCTVNEYTALIRVDNMGSADISNVKIGNTTIACYLQKGSVYDYWACSTFAGIVSITGAESSYSDDLNLSIVPNWEYNIYVITNEDGDNIWAVSVDKAGTGDEEDSEVKEFE